MQPAQSQSSALWCARCVTLRRVPHCGLLTSFRFHALLLSSQDASSGFFFPSSCMYLPSKYIAPGIRSDSLHCKSVARFVASAESAEQAPTRRPAASARLRHQHHRHASVVYLAAGCVGARMTVWERWGETLGERWDKYGLKWGKRGALPPVPGESSRADGMLCCGDVRAPGRPGRRWGASPAERLRPRVHTLINRLAWHIVIVCSLASGQHACSAEWTPGQRGGWCRPKRARGAGLEA